jgi:hypothetical protein
MGDPLANRRLSPGGGGAGIGEPLMDSALKPGGGGAGMGEPLRRATEIAALPLLDNCLTELLTGSTIEIARATNSRRAEIFFVMVRVLLVPTMRANWKGCG